MAQITISDLQKRYDNVEVLRHINLTIKDGEFVVLVGPSGCGKSTLLRTIAGLELATAGDIHIGTRLMNQVAPKDRDISMVFQSYALYPHMTVARNMGFSLEVQKRPKAEIDAAVNKAADILGLTALLHRRPKELSGGQRQRVWIAMVLAQQTPLLLLDEPTTWLDITHQIDLLELMQDLNRKLGRTLVVVLHDLNHACRYATHLIAMRDGKIVAEGAPSEIVTTALIEEVFGLRCMIIDDPVSHTPLVVPLGRASSPAA